MWLPPGTDVLAGSHAGWTVVPNGSTSVEISAERPNGSGDFVVGVRAFRQQVDDQMVTLFGVIAPETRRAGIGHYYVGNSGDFGHHGMGHQRLRGRRVAASRRRSITRSPTPNGCAARADRARLELVAASASCGSRVERLHDLTASVESEVPPPHTHVLVIYKLNSAFATADAVASPSDVRDAIRRTGQPGAAVPEFHGARSGKCSWRSESVQGRALDASVYDELLVIRPPKGVLGGLTVRFYALPHPRPTPR